MNLPREISHGLPIPELTKEFNTLVRAFRQIVPVSSSTVKVDMTSSGAVFHVKTAAVPRGSGGGGAGVPRNMSFTAEARRGEVNGAPVVEVKMLGGTAQGLFGGVQVFKTTYWTDGGGAPELFDDYDQATDELEDAAIANGELFWLEYDPEANAGEHWSIEHGASLPQSAVAESDEDAVNYFSFVTLFRVRLAESGKGVVQNHCGAVCVPTATNVVDVQTVAAQQQGQGGE